MRIDNFIKDGTKRIHLFLFKMSIFFETVLESSGFDDSYFIQIAEKSDDKIKSISEFVIFLSVLMNKFSELDMTLFR